MMSRKIDKINDLAGLPGDGGEVLVGGKCGSLRKKCGSLRENGGQSWDLRLGKVAGQLWIQ